MRRVVVFEKNTIVSAYPALGAEPDIAVFVFERTQDTAQSQSILCIKVLHGQKKPAGIRTGAGFEVKSLIWGGGLSLTW